MKHTFALTMPVLVAVTAAVGTLANTHTNMHARLAPVGGASPEMPKSGAFTSQGCYSTAPNMTDANVSSLFLSTASCAAACLKSNYAVAAVSPQNCYCGNTYPPKDNRVDDANCNYPCNGFTMEACGGVKNAFSIFNTGINLAPENYDDSSSSSSASSSSTEASSSSSASSGSTETSSSPSASSSASNANTSSSTSTQTSANSAKTSSSTSAATSASPTESKASPTPAKSNGANTASTAVSIVIGAVAAAIIGGIM
ncbi:hypothetical protein NQ176_g7654 [Zarea fungicola]|uniref:Uncharacterized protein n=1 Tax=Zarea fungicola TaxID=93591 RepID=A0ACC1MXG7_9HYPO|nr:hypothetical protein NQ176_g7654 [Lecanicillium fungicola]